MENHQGAFYDNLVHKHITQVGPTNIRGFTATSPTVFALSGEATEERAYLKGAGRRGQDLLMPNIATVRIKFCDERRTYDTQHSSLRR